jgi:hypothetical protein
MLTRRQLLARGTTLLLLTPVLSPMIAACSSDDSSGDDTGGTCDGFESTSTNNDNHTHTACVLTSDLDSPPAAGVTYTSSSVGHTHKITLSSAQLTTIGGGGSVTVTSSSDDGHTHNWTLAKA